MTELQSRPKITPYGGVAGFSRLAHYMAQPTRLELVDLCHTIARREAEREEKGGVRRRGPRGTNETTRLARAIGVAPVTVRSWASGEEPNNQNTEKLLRYALMNGDQATLTRIKQLVMEDLAKHTRAVEHFLDELEQEDVALKPRDPFLNLNLFFYGWDHEAESNLWSLGQRNHTPPRRNETK